MADTKNSLQLMRRNLLRLGVLEKLGIKPKQLEEPSLRASNPEIFLQLTNYLITEHSPSLFGEVIEIVPNIRSLPDKKFVQACYLIMRDLLECIPVINVQQFLSPKYFDLKLQFVAELARKVYDWDQARKTKKVIAEKKNELSYQRPAELKEVSRKQQSREEEDEEEQEPRIVTVAPTRIPRPVVEQERPKVKAQISRPERFVYDEPERASTYSQAPPPSQQDINDAYQLISNVSITLNEMVGKFNSFQESMMGWVNNINAKMTMLEDKVRVLQNNLM